MVLLRQVSVLFLALYCAGQVMRFPEQALTLQWQEKGYIRSQETLRLGQTGTAVVLGGLRSLVASGLNLQAFSAYTQQDWGEVQRLYQLVTTLQPNTVYYWETAGWHFTHNAYADYEDKPSLSAPRRQQKQRESLRVGEEFLLAGVQENPQSVTLWQQLGRLYSDPYKPVNYQKAAQFFQKAAASPQATSQTKREYFYILLRVRSRQDEAWELGTSLFEKASNRRFPSMRSGLYALSLLREPQRAGDQEYLLTFFPSKEQAYLDLVNYWQRTEREQLPRSGVKPVIQALARELKVPDRSNPFRNPDLTRLHHIW